MNLKLSILLAIFTILSSCEKLENDRSTILLNSSYNNWLKSEFDYSVWNPKKDDLKTLNMVLKKAIEEGQFNFYAEPIMENINKNSFKQFIPYLDDNGNRIILLNSFCQIPEMTVKRDGIYELEKAEWKTEYISVSDGGVCYWRITINIDKMEYSDLMVNGV